MRHRRLRRAVLDAMPPAPGPVVAPRTGLSSPAPLRRLERPSSIYLCKVPCMELRHPRVDPEGLGQACAPTDAVDGGALRRDRPLKAVAPVRIRSGLHRLTCREQVRHISATVHARFVHGAVSAACQPVTGTGRPRPRTPRRAYGQAPRGALPATPPADRMIMLVAFLAVGAGRLDTCRPVNRYPESIGVDISRP